MPPRRVIMLITVNNYTHTVNIIYPFSAQEKIPVNKISWNTVKIVDQLSSMTSYIVTAIICYMGS